MAWTVLVAWTEVSSGKRAGLLETAIAVGSGASGSVPLIIIYSILIVMVGNFILGGGIMVMARAAKEYLYDKIEKQREKLREEGREQGRMSLAAEIKSWNKKRLDAEARGEPFDEPPPGA